MGIILEFEAVNPNWIVSSNFEVIFSRSPHPKPELHLYCVIVCVNHTCQIWTCLLDSLSSSASCSFESVSGDHEGGSDSTIILQPSPITSRPNEDASLAQVRSADFFASFFRMTLYTISNFIFLNAWLQNTIDYSNICIQTRGWYWSIISWCITLHVFWKLDLFCIPGVCAMKRNIVSFFLKRVNSF